MVVVGLDNASKSSWWNDHAWPTLIERETLAMIALTCVFFGMWELAYSGKKTHNENIEKAIVLPPDVLTNFAVVSGFRDSYPTEDSGKTSCRVQYRIAHLFLR